MITAVDLFCGAGGAGCGMEQAGIDVVAGIDNDEKALETHEKNLDAETINHDLAVVDPTVLPTQDIDWVHGSPPCQGFSTASGDRSIDDERNNLVWSFIEWVDEIRPKVVTMENVTGMSSISDHFLEKICGSGRDSGQQQTLGGDVSHATKETDGFASIGYTARAKCLNAADYGVPQTRKRIFIVAVRDDVEINGSLFPEQTHRKDEWVTVGDAIGDLHTKNHGVTGESAWRSADTPSGTIGTKGNMYVREICSGEDSGRESPIDHNPESLSGKAQDYLYRDGQHLEKHSPNSFDEPPRTIPANIYKGVPYGLLELPEDVVENPSCTVSATRPYLLERGHAEHIQDRSIRRMTVRESARLQSFPDSFTFPETKTDAYRQIGNAVPPLLQRRIAEHIQENILDGASSTTAPMEVADS